MSRYPPHYVNKLQLKILNRRGAMPLGSAKRKEKKMSTKKSNNARTRNYACVVYPDSCKSNWLDILSGLHVPAFVSPLHDKDINPDGSQKKPHWHVMLMFDNVKTKEQAYDIFVSLGGAVGKDENGDIYGLEIIQSLRGYARYLCHLDNPEKAQYSQDLVRQFGGADYVNIIGLILDKYIAIGDMLDYCELNDIVSYSDLLLYARSERFDWFRVLCDSGTYVIKEFLKSREWSNRPTSQGGALRHPPWCSVFIVQFFIFWRSLYV